MLDWERIMELTRYKWAKTIARGDKGSATLFELELDAMGVQHGSDRPVH